MSQPTILTTPDPIDPFDKVANAAHRLRIDLNTSGNAETVSEFLRTLVDQGATPVTDPVTALIPRQRAVQPEQTTSSPSCPTWCAGDCRTGDGQIHELFIGKVTGQDVDSTTDRMHAAVDLEAYDSPDGTVHDDPSVVLTTLPAGRPEPIDYSVLNGLDGGQIRHLAAAALSGGYRGEKVQLTPAQAVLLGTYLIAAGEAAGARVPA